MRNPNASISDPNSFLSCPGDPVGHTYCLNADEDLIITGDVNLQAQYNSLAPSCDLNLLISRLSSGDFSVLRQTFYGDFSNVPSNCFEISNLVSRAQDLYDALPEGVRSEFSSFNDFLSSSRDPDFLSRLVTVQNNETEVSPDVS